MSRAASLLAIVLVSCAAQQRPRVLEDADATRQGDALRAAEKLAPQAFLAAEKIRREAEAAFESDDLAGAQILGEHSLAAYNHAVVLARLAKAADRTSIASKSLETAKRQLAAVDEQQTRVAAEADNLEMRVKVARDAMPLVPNAPTTPKREAARLAAARSLALQARLLCVAARLLQPKLEGLSDDLKALDEIDATLAATPKATPIDETIRLRSSCLGRLTKARRPAFQKAPEVGRADALLDLLSKAGLQPHRDDRGVVVVLRDVFRGARDLSVLGRSKLVELGQIAKQHGGFPVLVVLHSARGKARDRDHERTDAAVAVLREAGATRVEGRAAGGAHPVMPRDRRGAAKRNERLEVVFVAPTPI